MGSRCAAGREARRATTRAAIVAAALLLAGSAGAVEVAPGITPFAWSKAAGTVSAYAIFVERNGGGFATYPDAMVPASQQSHFVIGVPGDIVRVRVAAWGSMQDGTWGFGPLSPVSEPFAFVAVGADAVVNGSFEDGADPGEVATLEPADSGDLDAWTVLEDSVDYVGTAAQAVRGTRSVDLSGNREGGLVQTLRTEPTTRYRVTFWLRANPRRENKAYQVRAEAAQTLLDVEIDGRQTESEWRPFRFDFVAQETTTELRFTSLTRGSYGALIDDVQALPLRVIGKLYGSSVVVNGGFEEGAPVESFLTLKPGSEELEGWGVLAHSTDVIGDAFPAAEGARSLELTGNRDGGIFQAIPTVPGVEYRVSFALSFNSWGPNGVFPMQASAGGAVHSFLALADHEDRDDILWRTVLFDFVAEETTTLLVFESLADIRYYGPTIDRVEVRPRLQ